VLFVVRYGVMLATLYRQEWHVIAGWRAATLSEVASGCQAAGARMSVTTLAARRLLRSQRARIARVRQRAWCYSARGEEPLRYALLLVNAKVVRRAVRRRRAESMKTMAR